MKHRVRVIEREAHYREDLDTGEGVWFGHIMVEVPYRWQIEQAQKEFAARRATLSDEQRAKAQKRIDGLLHKKYMPDRIIYQAGPLPDRNAALTATEKMVDAARRMAPGRLQAFCHRLWYPEHGGFRPHKIRA